MISQNLAWAAVLGRDTKFDGRLVYGVTSTSIYCRPSCSSRRPKRENTRFFTNCDEAESAGFRACLRCDPNDTSVTLSERARRILDEQLEEGISLQELASRLNVSRFHLQRTFKKAFGVSPKQYQAAQKLEHVRQQLKEGADVLTAAYAGGFTSSSRIYERAGERLGMTPGEYRRGGRDLSIRSVVTETSLGKLLVGATPVGVCAVWFGETREELEEMLRAEFPAATITTARDRELERVVEVVVAVIEGRGQAETIPLDVFASVFQMRVWNALRSIPSGSTRSYGEIAEAIGAPQSARAVGNACGRNRLAYLIPCHRAVPASGGIGRYRWGSERKQELLRREGGGK